MALGILEIFGSMSVVIYEEHSSILYWFIPSMFIIFQYFCLKSLKILDNYLSM